MHATVAQSVERRLGKAEVGGSIPLGSFPVTVQQSKKKMLYKSWEFTHYALYNIFFLFCVLQERDEGAEQRNRAFLLNSYREACYDYRQPNS